MIDTEQFVELTGKLVHGMLREAIGYRVEYQIPYFQGIVGYMVETPLLWIRHSRFPILFIAYDQRHPDILNSVVKQVEIARATEHFALLIVVPTSTETGNEAQELRHIVADSVYRYDFVVLDRQYLASIIGPGSAQRLIEIILQQGIDLSSLSPYVVRGPVSDKMFFGREKEIKAIAQAIQTADFAVVGGRRIGKSSILLKLNRLLNSDPRYQAIYINCEDKFGHGDIFEALGRELGDPIDGEDPQALRKFVASLKGRCAKERLLFLLDEVDELLASDAALSPAGRLFKTFRSLSHEGACRFVFSGSRTLRQHLRNPQSPFFNFCQDLPLRPLEEKSITEIVVRPMRQLGIELPNEEHFVGKIISETSSHPNIVQWLCDRMIRSMSVRRLTVDDLHAVTADPEFFREYVGTAWGDATDLEKLISAVMESPSFGFEDVCKALKPYGFTEKDRIRESLDVLQLYSLLECDRQVYRFKLTQFPQFLRQVEDVPLLVESLAARVRI
jgi:AAA domain